MSKLKLEVPAPCNYREKTAKALLEQEPEGVFEIKAYSGGREDRGTENSI